MNISPTKISEVLLVELKSFGDDRGFFVETWAKEQYRAQGISSDFVQDSISISRKGVLRGIHFQNPHPQAKLVSVLDGEIYDVAVDLRVGSPTFGKWVGEVLSSKNRRQLFIPHGFGHGFCVLSDGATVSYKMSNDYYAKEAHRIRWDDPTLGIDWPIQNPCLSEKDKDGYWLSTAPKNILFTFAQ